MTPELELRLLRRLAECPASSQRELASSLSVSLGSINAILRQLQKRDLICPPKTMRDAAQSALGYRLSGRGHKRRVQLLEILLALKRQQLLAIDQEIHSLQVEAAELAARVDSESEAAPADSGFAVTSIPSYPVNARSQVR